MASSLKGFVESVNRKEEETTATENIYPPYHELALP